MSELRNDISEYGLKTESEISGANKVMEAKIVDLDDKLRLGMAKMQVIGYLDLNEYVVITLWRYLLTNKALQLRR